MNRKRVKVAVGLSGGVDSSVAAALLTQAGHEVSGITMEIYDGAVTVESSGHHACYGPGEEEDVRAAETVCKQLSIPFHVIDLRGEYREHVLRYFKSEYLAGRTPNPCIVCNRLLKFGFLLKKARAAGIDFEYFATGHYAQIAMSGDRFVLKKAVDRAKDQTYFLYGLTSKQLSRTMFPLGSLTKDKVRKIAQSFGLETAFRPESQDFITGRDYGPLFDEDDIRKGDIVDEKGRLLGKHRGIIHYTVGQRKGLGIASRHPLYVKDIDTENNRLIVSGKNDLFSKGLIASDLHFTAIDTLDKPYKTATRIRLRHTAVEATVSPYRKNKARVIFEDPQLAVAPGQSVVFYDGDIVFGGGIIERAL